MQTKDQKIDQAAKKAAQEDPKIAKRAKELFSLFNKLPKDLKEMLRISYSNSVSLKNIESELRAKAKSKEITKHSENYEQQVRLAAIEAKDITELKRKLKIEF